MRGRREMSESESVGFNGEDLIYVSRGLGPQQAQCVLFFCLFGVRKMKVSHSPKNTCQRKIMSSCSAMCLACRGTSYLVLLVRLILFYCGLGFYTIHYSQVC